MLEAGPIDKKIEELKGLFAGASQAPKMIYKSLDPGRPDPDDYTITLRGDGLVMVHRSANETYLEEELYAFFYLDGKEVLYIGSHNLDRNLTIQPAETGWATTITYTGAGSLATVLAIGNVYEV